MGKTDKDKKNHHRSPDEPERRTCNSKYCWICHWDKQRARFTKTGIKRRALQRELKDARE